MLTRITHVFITLVMVAKTKTNLVYAKLSLLLFNIQLFNIQVVHVVYDAVNISALYRVKLTSDLYLKVIGI